MDNKSSRFSKSDSMFETPKKKSLLFAKHCLVIERSVSQHSVQSELGHLVY